MLADSHTLCYIPDGNQRHLKALRELFECAASSAHQGANFKHKQPLVGVHHSHFAKQRRKKGLFETWIKRIHHDWNTVFLWPKMTLNLPTNG